MFRRQCWANIREGQVKTILIVTCLSLVPSLARGQEHAERTCEDEAPALNLAVLQTTDPIHLRLWTESGHYEGRWLGYNCKGVAIPNGAQTLTIQIRDIRRLQVGRLRRAGWKGALIGAALGAGLGAALKIGDTRGRGAAIGGVGWAIDGALLMTTRWRDVPLPTQVEAATP
jgi:hypothetical protein